MEFRTPRQVSNSKEQCQENISVLKKIKQRFIYFLSIYVSSYNIPDTQELWTILPSHDQAQPPQSLLNPTLLTSVTPTPFFPLDAIFLSALPCGMNWFSSEHSGGVLQCWRRCGKSGLQNYWVWNPLQPWPLEGQVPRWGSSGLLSPAVRVSPGFTEGDPREL